MPLFGKKKKSQPSQNNSASNRATTTFSADAATAEKISKNTDIINRAIERKYNSYWLLSAARVQEGKRFIKYADFLKEADEKILNDYLSVIKKINESQIFINSTHNKIYVLDLSKPDVKKYLLENIFPDDLSDHLALKNNYPTFQLRRGDIYIKFPSSSLHQWSAFNKLDYLTRERYEQVKMDVVINIDNIDFSAGYNDSSYEVGKIEGYADNMTLTAMRQLAIKLYQDPENNRLHELGVLSRHIDYKQMGADFTRSQHQVIQEKFEFRNQFKDIRKLYDDTLLGYKEQYSAYLAAEMKNSEFQKVAKMSAYASIYIPGFVPGMSKEEMQNLFIDNARIVSPEDLHPSTLEKLTPQELGALSYRIKAISSSQIKFPEYNSNMSLKEVCMLYLQYVEKVDSTSDQLDTLSYFVDKAVARTDKENIQVIKGELDVFISSKRASQKIQNAMNNINLSFLDKDENHSFIDQDLIDFVSDYDEADQSSKNQPRPQAAITNTNNDGPKKESILMPAEPEKIENQNQKAAAASSDIFETPIVTIPKQIIVGESDAPMNMLAHNSDAGRLLANHEGQNMAYAFQKASIALYQEHNIPTEYMPLIESITKSLTSPNKYEITFYDPNASDVNTIRKVETTKPIFMKTKQYLDRLTKTQPQINGNRIPAGTGLSVLFAIKVLLSSNDHSEWSRMNPLSHNLARAIQLHNYFNLAGLGVGVLQDGLVVASMGALSYLNHLPPKFQTDFKYIIRQENLRSFIQVGAKVGLNVKPLEQLLPRIMQVSEKASSLAPKLLLNLGKSLPVANTIFNGGSVGFDIYQLAHAENSHQQKVFGTQLAISSVCFGLSVGGMVAAYSGASAIAGPLFVITLPIAVTGGGVVQVMQNYGNMEQAIKERVVKYFKEVQEAYQKVYNYDRDTNSLAILSGAVVKKIDFEAGSITLGSQYLCIRDKADLRRVNSDNTDAINIRSRYKGKDVIDITNADKTAGTIILPNTPISYVSYNTANIQALEKYKGDDYNSIGPLEGNVGFELERFNLIWDNIVTKLFHKYEPTEVDVNLDSLNRAFIIPELPTQTAKALDKESTILFSNNVNEFDNDRNNNHQLETLSNAITYNFTGKGGQYTIGLNERATICISSSEAKPSRWILNTNNLDKDDVEIHADKLIIGGVTVDIDPIKNSGSELIVVKQDGDVCAIDINTKSSKVIQLDAEKWGKKQPKEETFDAHLKKIVQEGRFSGEYIPVDNYSHGDEKVGRAYYDLKKDRMLFSSGAQIDGNWGAIMGENVYFYNKEHGCIWEVEASTGKVKIQYFLDDLADLVKDEMRIWQQNDQLYAAIDYTYNQGNKGEFIYNLKDDSIELVSLRINTERANIFKRQSLLTFYLDAQMKDCANTTFEFPNAKIISTIKLAPWVTIYDKDDQGSGYRYWLRTSDKMLFKPDLPDMSADKALRLKFIGSIQQAEGSEIFYFLDSAENALYRQEGAEPQIPNPSQSLASRVDGNFISAEIVENNLLASTKEGLIQQVGIKGDLTLVAVKEQWLSKEGINWCQKLRSLSAGTQVMISGLRDKNGVLPAWCIDRLVVIAPTLAGHVVLLLDVDDEGFARLFDSTTNRLYKQKGTSSSALLKAFGDDHMLDDSQQLAGPTELLASQEFKSVLKEGNIIRLVTKEGVIISLDRVGKLQLIGVDQAWQAAHVHDHDQSVALDLLAQNTAWSHADVIVLQGATEHSTPAWYHVDLKLRVDADGLTISDKPEFIGTIKGVNDAEVYITDQKGGIHRYNYTKSVPSSAYKFISSNILYKDIHTQRLGEALLMKGTDTADSLNPLVLDGVTSMILSGGEGEDTYSITEDTRKKIKEIIVNNYASDKAKDRLELYAKNINETVLLRKDNDLLFSDHEGVVSLRNVFGDYKVDYNHLEVCFKDGTKQTTYAIANLVTQMENFQSDPSIIASSYYLSEFNQS